MSGVEALARVLPLPGCNCEAHYSQGGSRLCKVWRERDRLRQARDILADPGPLLEALAEAGILREETSDPHAGHGCWQDPDEREGWQECGPETNERRYVTEWEVDDD